MTTNTTEMTKIQFKTHENKLRRMAERQGFFLVKSWRHDPRARGHGTYVLIPETRHSFDEPRDPRLVDAAQAKMERGEGLTLQQLEAELGYGDAS